MLMLEAGWRLLHFTSKTKETASDDGRVEQEERETEGSVATPHTPTPPFDAFGAPCGPLWLYTSDIKSKEKKTKKQTTQT